MKIIDAKDLKKMQCLKPGESLATSKYIITCTEAQKSYIIDFYRVKK